MNDSLIKEYLIFFSKNVVDMNNQNTYNKIDMFFDKTIFLNDIPFLQRNNLIINNENSIYSLTEKGERFLNQIIEEDKYIAEKERIEFEKSKIELELSQKMLKEFPKTKWLARVGLFIAIVLALKELYILLKPQA